MPQSLARVYIHLVFSTKSRRPYLLDETRPSLHAYMATVLRNQGCVPLAINSVEDHIHLLFVMTRTVAISKVVERVKTSSSKWIKTQGPTYSHFAWQSGYGAFSVSESHLKRVETYIARQREHHKRKAFKDEFRALLLEYNVSYDERFVWN